MYLKTVRFSFFDSSPDEHEIINASRNIYKRLFFIAGIFLSSSLSNQSQRTGSAQIQLLTVFLTNQNNYQENEFNESKTANIFLTNTPAAELRGICEIKDGHRFADGNVKKIKWIKLVGFKF